MDGSGAMDKKAEVVHETEVSRQGGIEGSALYQATCKCGWKGPWWTRRSFADEDGGVHIREYED